MDYVGHVIRPPSEAYSMIIQVTVGCSHNMCTFCGTYKEQKFRVKDMALIKRDIDEASREYPYTRAFLADGDVLILPAETIIEIIEYIKMRNPRIERVGVYGNSKAILKKKPEELKALQRAGLGIIYQGIESGNEKVLRKIKKGSYPSLMIDCSDKVKDAGILLSQTVLLGIGGIELSTEHAVDTGKLLSAMSPDYAGALTLMLLPNTELHRDFIEGKFRLPDKFGMLEELKLIIENFQSSRKCLFTSNHASNYLPIRAYFPDQRVDVLKLINEVLSRRDEGMLKPEYMRGL